MDKAPAAECGRRSVCYRNVSLTRGVTDNLFDGNLDDAVAQGVGDAGVHIAEGLDGGAALPTPLFSKS